MAAYKGWSLNRVCQKLAFYKRCVISVKTGRRGIKTSHENNNKLVFCAVFGRYTFFLTVTCQELVENKPKL